MSSTKRWLAATIGVLLVVFVLGPALSILITSWCRRLEASRLLASARLIHPGVTTEPETRRVLARFDKYLSHGAETISGHPTVTRDSYWIANYPDWVLRLAPRLPGWINQRIWFLPYSNFSVSPRYRNGELVLLELRETQDHKNDIHPYAAIVRVLSTRSEKDAPELPDSFTGFLVNPYEEMETDENGKQIGPSWIVREYVTFDERASPEQIAHSFGFRLSCLTSLFGCRDARKILPIKQ